MKSPIFFIPVFVLLFALPLSAEMKVNKHAGMPADAGYDVEIPENIDLTALENVTEMVRGEITGLSPETGVIMVSSVVMGLTGPEKKDISFRVDEKTLLKLCWNGICNEGAALKELGRLKDFSYFQAENISVIGRKIELQYAKEGTDRIESVNIYAPMPNYYFNPSDFVSPF